MNEMARLFFLHPENKAKVKELKKGLQRDDCAIYLGNSFQSEEEKKNSFEYCYLKKIEEKACQRRFTYNLAWTQKWAFEKIGGKSFAEELVYEGKSMWYPAEYFLHFDESILSSDPPVSRILMYMDCIKKILEEKKPSLVCVENNRNCFNNIVILLCKKEKIVVKDIGIGRNNKSNKNSLYQLASDNQFLARTYISGRIFLRFLIGKLFCKKTGTSVGTGGRQGKDTGRKPDVLVLTSDRLSNKENTTDYYWGPIIKELEKRRISYKMVEYDRIDSLNSFANVKRRYLPQKYDAQFIGTYYDRATCRNYKQIKKFLKNKFFELDSNENFKKSFNYNGISFYELIRPRLKKIFLTYSNYIADVYAISKSIIEKEKPKIILVDHEKNYYGRALLSEANNTDNNEMGNNNGIFSFAFEGELIFDNNTYLTQVPIKSILERKSGLWRPIADKKLLWSEYTRKWYNENNYFPESNLKIIGAPKYDFIKELDEKDVARIKNKYGVAKGMRLITAITPDLPWEKDYVTSIFQSLKGIANIKVVLKLHPNETILNKNMIESLVRKFKLNAEAVMDENSSKLVYASDLVISYGSTLTYECILMNKNTVLLNPDYKIEDPYVKEGLLRQCSSDAEFKKEIQNNLVQDKNHPGESKKTMNQATRKKFIEKYLHSDDGKASERAVDEIMKVLNSKLNTK